MNPKVELTLSNTSLKVDRSIIIASFNNNSLLWHQDKTIEECIKLTDTLLKAKKDLVANEHICRALADVQIQLALLSEIYGASNIQLFINDRLTKIASRNKRLVKRVKKVGFANGLDNNG